MTWGLRVCGCGGGCDSLGCLQATRKWQEGSISNFMYLQLLNKYAGRSYCDINCYPVPTSLSTY